MHLLASVATYVVLSTAGLLLLRDSLQGAALEPSLLARPRVIAGAALYALSFLSWLLALRRYELTTIFPVFIGLGYSAVILAAVAFLDERLAFTNILGIVLVGVGVVLVVR